LVKAGKPIRYEGAHKNDVPPGLDKKTGQGNSQVSECHNIQMAEVEVNTETGATKVLKMTVAVDAGTIVNPQAFEGQLEGAWTRRRLCAPGGVCHRQDDRLCLLQVSPDPRHIRR